MTARLSRRLDTLVGMVAKESTMAGMRIKVCRPPPPPPFPSGATPIVANNVAVDCFM